MAGRSAFGTPRTDGPRPEGLQVDGFSRTKGLVGRQDYLKAAYGIFQMIADIGDDLFAAGGVDAIGDSILNTMKFGSKILKDSQYSPLAVKEIAIKALTRWGVPIPLPHVEPVRHCHICNQSNQEIRVQFCFLLDCQNAVCEEHAAILESGRSTVWFC